MFRSDGTESDTHDSVSTCCEYVELAILNKISMRISNLMLECKTDATTFTNPILLHCFDALRPTQSIKTREQLLCIGRDIEVITRDFTFLYQSSRAPTTTIDYLLICQDCLIDRIPIYYLSFAIRNSLFEHLQKEPLIPTIVIWTASGYFTRPING